MPYISMERIVSARKKIEARVSKPETFSGLLFFLMSVKNKKLDGRYLEAEMAKFSDFVDKAFYLRDIDARYSNKTWYALLSNDWLDSILNYYLKGQKLLVNDLLISLFWYLEGESLDQLVKMLKDKLGADIFDELFTYEPENVYVNPVVCTRLDLFNYYEGENNHTIKFNGTFLAKQASDLSGAPFAQTLYSSQEIKKTISIFDFDFIDKFNLSIEKNNSYNFEVGENRLSKPFVLLAGISGTGKTRFVREQAKASGSLAETYCLVSVRPDWHEPSDVLGYISRLRGKSEYITTDILNFIAKAWKALIDAGLMLNIQSVDGYGERLYVSGNISQLDQIPPYWLCLDEMNLAPVEQYFADYLSVLETREWHWNNEDFKYLIEPLLKANVLTQIENKTEFRQQLGLDGSQYDAAWDAFLKFGIGIPFNLLVAGTVNMDETTHGFSRKVIDRALSFDFGDFFPNDYEAYFESRTQNKTLSYPILSSVKLADLPEIDSEGKETIRFLNAINELLHNTSFKLAYRALNELLLAVVSQNPKNKSELFAVWDDFLMCKVMPRIEGDSDKLMNGRSDETLLQELISLIQKEFDNFNEQIDRPDLYREFKEGDNIVISIGCRSLEKLRWMQTRLENSGFTSFWP
ncbi:MAG: McrB family protein [Acinetobacter sp.]